MKPVEWTVGSADGKTIGLELTRSKLSFEQAVRLRDQLSEVIEEVAPPSYFAYDYDCTKPRPMLGFIYPTDWHRKKGT